MLTVNFFKNKLGVLENVIQFLQLYCSCSDMLGLRSLKATGTVYCPLLYVLSLALAASAQLSPPLLQLNKSTLHWQTPPGCSHLQPFFSVATFFFLFLLLKLADHLPKIYHFVSRNFLLLDLICSVLKLGHFNPILSFYGCRQILHNVQK